MKRHQGTDHLERNFTPIKKAGRMGVLYRADQEYSQALIKKLNKWCEAHHIRLMSMGYVDDKSLVGDYNPHRNSDFFCNKHLNRLRLPEKSEFVRFSNERMELLLNLYCDPCLPLLGISSFSEAQFRVGPHLPNFEFCFDLMLDTKTTDVMTFTDEVLDYLSRFGDGKV